VRETCAANVANPSAIVTSGQQCKTVRPVNLGEASILEHNGVGSIVDADDVVCVGGAWVSA
jgi:hypothetical protein